ncbi:MAG: polysaccharide biosynthesis tyrosine autokinase [Opitutae bacterium]|nr:polysaccharide biosynthesis tyrosine autokinase [Opitutae bacterium]
MTPEEKGDSAAPAGAQDRQDPKNAPDAVAPETETRARGYYGYYGNGYRYGSYGSYGSGGYGSGYGSGIADVAGSISETMQNRTLGDYVTIFRERIWYLILTVFIIITGVLVYTYNIVPEFTASGRVQVLRQAFNLSGGISGRNSSDLVTGQDDFMTQVEIMMSEKIIERVQARLTQEELSEVVDPYRAGNIFTGPLTPMEVIAAHRTVQPRKSTFIVTVAYTHRTKEIARKMTDYFIDEICKANMEMRQVRVSPIIDSTRIKIEHLQQQLDDERRERAELVKREDLLNIDMGTAAQELSSINSARDSERKNYEDLLAIRNELDQVKKSGGKLVEQPAIAQNSLVATLLPRVADLRISVSSMREKYGDKHPQLIQAAEQLAAAEKELDVAIAKADAEFQANFVASKRRYESAQQRAVEKNAQLSRLREASTQLETMDEQIRNDAELLQRLKINLEDQNLMLTTTSTSIVQVLDTANVPNMPSNKNFLLNALFGLIGGLVLGSGIVVLLSFFDDKIKSAKDVETSLGIPLLSSVVRLRGKGLTHKATIVRDGKNRSVIEAFIGLYSSLKIGEISKNAKVIALTSTIPSEGKTFISTNLAQTFANHGEKTLLIDGDLRLPNIAKSLEVTGEDHDLLKYISGDKSIDDVILKDYHRGLDILPVVKGIRNPTEVINSKKFETLLEELRKRYDKIVIDTPPVAAVSDVLGVLPLCDGVIYVIKWNTSHRLLVRANLRRLEEAKVPVLGAVLNQITRHIAHHYTYSAGYTYAAHAGYYKNDAAKHEVKVK